IGPNLIPTRCTMQFDGKTAIVTGAASGLGRAIALKLAERGARLIVSDIDEEGGSQTVESIGSKGGKASFCKADTSKPEDNENLVKEALERHGALHIAVNNAGIGGPNLPVG